MLDKKIRTSGGGGTDGKTSALRRLARYYGVQTTYTDVSGNRQQASAESLLHVVRAMGAPVESLSDVDGALREWKQSLWNRFTEPVSVVWGNEHPAIRLSVPRTMEDKKLTVHVQLESGESRSQSFKPKDLSTIETAEIEGLAYSLKELALQGGLPLGYHDLTLEAEGERYETKIICAPVKAYSGENEERIWGVFLPLYALHSRRSWGAGDFSDMEALYGWLKGHGGQMIATLPFLATFLDEPFEPSPYSPASRLFWNEFYLNFTIVPEFSECREAQSLFEHIEARELDDLRSSPLVDYRKQMGLKRKVLEKLSTCIFQKQSGRRSELEGFVKSHPALDDYANFRAVCEKQGQPWPNWPERLRNGSIGSEDYDERIKRYHLYVQWLAQEQIRVMAEKARQVGPGLYLDLPLGVHPYAYDLWRERELFPENVSGGAPPDIVFTKGQDWGFPPLHPQRIREDRYRYVIGYLSHIMRHAGMMRIDHAPGLHRIYWIPRDLDSSQGVYVRYASDEIYAILSLESHKNQCQLVGENLGTVPEYVNEALGRHNVQKMYVVQYELEGKDPRVLRPIPPRTTASLNTHDMAPFAGFLNGVDIPQREDMGLLNADEAKEEQKNRQKTRANLKELLKRKGWLNGDGSKEDLMQGSLAFLSSSPARIVLVNLEDLWLEEKSQNMPGTSVEQPNWRRKARYSFEDLEKLPQVVDTLKNIDRLRKKRNRKPNRNIKK
jgi:4-alpha-glucanotransferase